MSPKGTVRKRAEAQKTALLEVAKDIAGTLDIDQLLDCVQRRTAELPAGSVTVTVRPHEAGVEITVADTGIGIAPETVPIIFDPFRQGG